MNPKDLERIKTLFNDAFTTKKALTVLKKYEHKKDMIASNYMIYSFAALPALIEKMKRLNTSWNTTDKYQARFVVDENKTIWFALEGRPGELIEYTDGIAVDDIKEQAPAHSDMTPGRSSIASGIVVFSNDYRIKKITNFSGHFRPVPSTLVWPIAALLNLGAEFTPEVELGFFSKDRPAQLKQKIVSLSKVELQTLLPEGYISALALTYEICVYSQGKLETFGKDQTPQFQKKQEQPQENVFKRQRTNLLFAENSHRFWCTTSDTSSSSRATEGSISSPDEPSASRSSTPVPNTTSFTYETPPPSPNRPVVWGNVETAPFSDFDSDHENNRLLI